MKEKLQSIIRHLLTGLSTYIVDTGLLSQADADETVRLAAAILAIVVTRVVLWGLAKINFKGLVSETDSKFPMLLIGVCMAVGFGGFLPSCNSLPNLRIPEGSSVGARIPIPGVEGFGADVECDSNGCSLKVEPVK